MILIPARLFGPTLKAVCRNIDSCLRVVPASIYDWEISCVRGYITITETKLYLIFWGSKEFGATFIDITSR